MNLSLPSIKKYLDQLERKGYSTDAINKKLGSVRQFLSWRNTQGLLSDKRYHQILNLLQSRKHVITETQPSPPIPSSPLAKPAEFFPYRFIALSFAIISVWALFATIKNQLTVKTRNSLAAVKTPVHGGRFLSFGGRLTDSLGNPINERTKVQFKFYNGAAGGKRLYTSGVCTIYPTIDGSFAVLIGKNCGKEIPAAVFTENQNVYVGITVGTDPEMTPRQQIANVGFAVNAEAIGGFSLGQSPGSLPFLNSSGDMLIAAPAPGIRSTLSSATFVLSSAKALTLQSSGTGDITLHATQSGSLKFLVGGVEIARVSNSGRLGVGTNSPDAKLELSDTTEQLRLTYGDSSTYTSLMTNAGGDLTISPSGSDTLLGGRLGIGVSNPSFALEVGGDAKIVDGNDLILGTSTTEGTGVNGSIYYNSTQSKFRCYEGDAWKDCDTAGGTGTAGFLSKWSSSSTIANSVLYETSSRIGIGTTAPSVTFDVSGSGKFSDNLTIGDSSSDTLSIAAGSVTFSNPASFDLANSSAVSLTFESGLFTIDTSNSRVGIGTTAPATTLDVAGDVEIHGSTTSYTQRLCHSGTDGAVTNLRLGDCAAGGQADIAEFYSTSGESEPGDIMIANSGLPFRLSRSTLPYQYQTIGIVSTNPTADGILGNKKDMINPQPVALAGRVPLKVSLENGPIKAGDPLTPSSGPGTAMKATKPGIIVAKALEDYDGTTRITSSVLAEEQERAIVHKNDLPAFFSDSARWPENTGKIMTFISNSWYDPTIFISSNGLLDSTNQNTPGQYIYDGDVQADTTNENSVWPIVKDSPRILANSIISAVTQTDQLITKTARITNAQIDSLTVKTVQVENKLTSPIVETDHLSAATGSISNLDTASVTAETATIEGTLSAEKIESPTIDDLRSQDSYSSDEIKKIHELIDRIKKDPIADTASYTKLREDIDLLDSQPSDTLTNYGQTTLFDTTILGTAIINNISIADNEVIALSDELKLSALSRISFFDGGVMVTRDGTITLQGELIAQKGVKTNKLTAVNPYDDIDVTLNSKDKTTRLNFINEEGLTTASIDASGSAIFADIQVPKSINTFVASPNEDATALPSIQTLATAAGSAVLPAGEDKLVIYNSKITPTSLIYISPTSSTQNKSLYISEKKLCDNSQEVCEPYFIVSLDEAIDTDVDFNWWIIQ